jgi:hypothetical protein
MRAAEDRAEKGMLARVAGSAGRWALVLGAVGFACGFFGPIALSPEANQGPLLGIFISGPGGALLGVILGVAFGILPLPKRVQATSLVVVAIAVALVTLYYSTPSPKYRATIVDAQFRDCQLPDTLKEATLADWDKRIEKVTWAEPRAGWIEDFDRMLREPGGVVVTLDVRRSTRVYENRKPWNRGTLILQPWQSVGTQKKYFAMHWGTTCEDYADSKDGLFVETGATSTQWPPELLPNLLDLPTIEPVPAEYRALGLN